MEMIWKAAAIVMLTVILSAAVGKAERDIAIVLVAAACCGVSCMAVYKLEEVITFLWSVGRSVEYQNAYTGTLLKITGVAVVAEITSLFGMDAGCSSLQKAMQLLGNAMILSLALPLFENFTSIVQEILNFV